MFRETKKMNPRQYFKSFVEGLDYIPDGKTAKIKGHPLPSFYDEGRRSRREEFFSWAMLPI